MSEAIPKEPREESPHLRAMARKFGCYLRLHSRCTGPHYTATTVLAHENSLDANKGTGYKAHDWRGVYACARCHDLLDQSYALTYTQKQEGILRGLFRQAALYSEIARSPTSKAKDRAAAQWALVRLDPYLATQPRPAPQPNRFIPMQ